MEDYDSYYLDNPRSYKNSNHNNNDNTLSLILRMLEEQRDEQKEHTRQLQELSNKVVGWENFRHFQDAITTRQDKLEERVAEVERICTSYEAIKPSMIDEASLLEAKADVIKENSETLRRFEEKLDAIDNRTQILTLSWQAIKSSKGAILFLVSLAAIIFGVYYGRGLSLYEMIQVMGWENTLKIAAIVAGIMMFAGIVIYIILKNEGKIRMHFQ